MFYSPASSKNNNSTFVSRLLIGQLPHACQSQAPLQAALLLKIVVSTMKQNIEIYLADAAPCTRVVLVLGISVTDFFLILAEFGHSDRNGGILCKKRKNSAKIGMVGSYAVGFTGNQRNKNLRQKSI